MKKTTHETKIFREEAVRLTLPSEPGYEKIAMDTTGIMAQKAGLADDKKDDLCTAVSEACLNGMQHGNKFSPKKCIEVIFTIKNNALEVEIYDKGAGIQNAPMQPVLENKIQKNGSPGGWGLFLIKKLVDHLEYGLRNKDGHVVRLTMYR